MAVVIVTLILMPQSLAYTLLPDLPLEMRLYASILPLIAYPLFSPRTRWRRGQLRGSGHGRGDLADDRRGGGGRSAMSLAFSPSSPFSRSIHARRRARIVPLS